MAHLDVTAFLSLMVILVPFLLISAVFSRITILELYGSTPGDSNPIAEHPSVLEIIVRDHAIEVNEPGRGRIARIDNDATGYRLSALSTVLEETKMRVPSMTEVNILVEPQTPYDVVIQVMDAARVKVENEAGSVRTIELFSKIALGDAP